MIYGLLAGILSGLDTVLLGIALNSLPFVSTKEAIFLAPFVSAFFHDFFTSMWMAIYMGFTKKLKGALKMIDTPSGRCIMVAAIFAGPVGMTAYMLSILYLGPAYAAIISSLFPAVGAFLSYVFLKEKMSRNGMFGLFISILGVIILGYGGSTKVTNLFLGFIWALITVLGWASEAVICSYGLRRNDITPEQSLQIRQLTSCFINGVLVLPLVGGVKFAIGVIPTSTTLIIIGTTFFATIGSLCYYKAIKKIGAIRSMSLDITYAAWAIVFGVIILGNSLEIKSIICCTMIISGSIMAAKK